MPMAERKKIVLAQFGQNSSSAVSARYLSGILRAQGYQTTIVCIDLSKNEGSGSTWDYGYYDLSDAAIKNFFEICKGSLVVSFTVYSFVAHIVRKIYASEHNKEKIPVLVGGPHPTLDPQNSSFFSDYVCVGDGEKGIAELAQKLSQGPVAVPGNPAAMVAENIFSSAALRASTQPQVLFGKESEIDSQTMPDFSFESEYYLSDKGVERITRDNAAKYIDVYATFFSRGCVNNCTFCGHEMIAERSGFQKRIKTKTVAHFVQELKELRGNYPWLKRVVFFDPNILSNNRESLAAVLAQYREHVALPFTVTGFTFNQINEKLYRDFLTAGMDSVIFGIESASEKSRKLFNRRESKDQILRVDALNQTLKKEFSFHVQYDIILDSPWESPDDALESLIFISRLHGYDYLDIFSLRFLPGTKLFQKALDEGIIKAEDVEKENQRVYRSLNYTYENFLFLLMRDNLLRAGWLFHLAVRPGMVTFMRKVFQRQGRNVFKIYSSRPVTQLVVFRRRIGKLGTLLKTKGLKTTFKIIVQKIRKKS